MWDIVYSEIMSFLDIAPYLFCVILVLTIVGSIVFKRR